MNILLTGGAGYIGSHTANVFLDNGYRVAIIDNLVNGDESLIPKKSEFLKCDISDQDKVSSFLEKNKLSNALIISDDDTLKNINKSARNIKDVKLIKDEGTNIYDLLNNTFRKIKVNKDPDCKFCSGK